MYFAKGKELDLIVNHKADEVVANLQHRLNLTNKSVTKEAKKCKNYGDAIDVMFKRYRERGRQHRDALYSLSADKANKVIEKEIFQTL